MNKRVVVKSMVIAMVAAFAAGCGGTKVARVDTRANTDLSDRWNDTDSRLVAEEMIDDMLSFPWIQRFKDETGKERPRVIIQRVRNKSHEHIAVDTFINDLKRAMIRSGKVDFVVGGAEREDVRGERRDQDLHAREDTRAEMGQELGADFALSGSINSIVDQVDGTRVTFYQTDLKLIDLETNREVWNGQKKIKKVMERSSVGF